jgi:hypothetical protein
VLQFFEICCESCLCDLRKSIKKISFNCYEATLDYRNHLTNGYGKNYNEALVSAVNNLLEKLLEDERTHPALRECLKRFSHTCSPDLPSEKVKTLPDAPDKRTAPAPRTIDSSCRPKENLMKSVKTIKEEIFESLNRKWPPIQPITSSCGPHSRPPSQKILPTPYSHFPSARMNSNSSSVESESWKRNSRRQRRKTRYVEV